MARVSVETTGQAADADTRNATNRMIPQAHQRSVERAIIVWARKGFAAMAEWDEIRAEMRAASGFHPERVDVAPMEEPREPQICAWLKGIGWFAIAGDAAIMGALAVLAISGEKQFDFPWPRLSAARLEGFCALRNSQGNLSPSTRVAAGRTITEATKRRRVASGR